MAKTLPPSYFLLGLALVAVLHWLAPVANFSSWPLRLAGIAAIAAGAALNLAADRQFKTLQTTVKPFERPTALASDGVFRFTRNPMYLGMTLILLGSAALLGSLSPIAVGFAFAALMDLRFIPVEERMLAQVHGPRWDAYRAKTRRWI